MTVTVTQPSINVREKLAELDKPTGIAGEAMLRAETPQEQFNLIGAGRRNLIINGAMQHWQRSTSAGVSSSNGNSYLACDRWTTIFDVANSATATISQSTDVPSGQGFKYSQLHTVTATDTVTLSAFRYILEGYDHANILGNWVTVSFWFKASVAGNYSYNHHVVSNGGVMKQFNYPTANVWQKVEMTYYVPEDAIYNTSSGIGSRLYVVLGVAGSSSGTTEYPNWNASGTIRYGLGDDQVALNKISGATAQITGVQLEVGKVATPFEHRSYGEELALCQRYFQRLGHGAHEFPIAFGYLYGDGEKSAFSAPLAVSMRSTPSLEGTGNALVVKSGGTQVTLAPSHFTVAYLENASQIGIYSNTNSHADMGSNHDSAMLTNTATDETIDLDAEL